MSNKLVERLNRERKQRGESYRQFADYLGVSHSHIINVLHGKSPVTWDFAEKVAQVFDMNVLDAFVEAGLVPSDKKC